MGNYTRYGYKIFIKFSHVYHQAIVKQDNFSAECKYGFVMQPLQYLPSCSNDISVEEALKTTKTLILLSTVLKTPRHRVL
jgi:hypothetical protein